MDDELVLYAVMLVVILWLFCVALCCRFIPRVHIE